MRSQRNDSGHIGALEGTLAAILLLGSAAFVATTAEPPHDPPSDLATRLRDILTLFAYPDSSGRAKLETVVTDALHDRLQMNTVERLLPSAAGWDLTLSNGIGDAHLAGRPTPHGTATTASILLSPYWTHAKVVAFVEEHRGVSGDTMRVAVIPTERSVASAGTAFVRFPNGYQAPVTARADGLLVSAALAPATPSTPGFAVPYDLTGQDAYAASIAALAEPVAYVANTTTIQDGTGRSYRVVPAAPLTSDLQDAFTLGKAVAARRTVAVREQVVFSYDYTGLPNGTATSCAVRVTGPGMGNVAVDDAVACPSGTWAWTVPAGALLGTHVADFRVVVETLDGRSVTAHDIVTFDVTRSPDTPTVAVYRVALSAWTD